MHQGISCVVLQHLVALDICAAFVQTICFDVADIVLEGSKDQHILSQLQKLCICRPRGRSSIIIPAGGATATAWGTFRDALTRIEVAGQQVLLSVPLHVEESPTSCCFDSGPHGHTVTKATFACSAIDIHHALSSFQETIAHVPCK